MGETYDRFVCLFLLIFHSAVFMEWKHTQENEVGRLTVSRVSPLISPRTAFADRRQPWRLPTTNSHTKNENPTFVTGTGQRNCQQSSKEPRRRRKMCSRSHKINRRESNSHPVILSSSEAYNCHVTGSALPCDVMIAMGIAAHAQIG